MLRTLVFVLAVLAIEGSAYAQPGAQAAASDPSSALRAANAAATQGDWASVNAYVGPLLAQQLDPADLAEAHRLAGIAAYYAQDKTGAEQHFLAYLQIDLDGHLDPALYEPEVISFFENVRSKHASELRARRPKAKNRYWVLNLLPPWGQFQNGERTKGIVIAAMMGTFLAANLTTYFVVKNWCFQQSRDGNQSLGCDATSDHDSAAQTLRSVNITAGVALILTYVWGVYDGVRGYGRARREPALVPYANATNGGTAFGVQMNF